MSAARWPVADDDRDFEDLDFGGRSYRPSRRVEVLRRIDPWSTLKVSLALYLCVFVAGLAVGVALWYAGRETGVIGNFESIVEDLGLAGEGSYRLKGGEILVISAVVGPILAIMASLATVLGAALYNVAARLFGGLEVTVQDGDELGRRPPR